MNQYLNRITLSLLVLVSCHAYSMDPAKSRIIVSSELSEILNHTPKTPSKNVLVATDIDDTKGRAVKYRDKPSEVGSDAMFSHAFSKALAEHGDAQAAIQAVLPHYIEAQMTHDFVPTEECAAQIIAEIQEKCYVIGLTARSMPLMDRTAEQLRGIGIDFTYSHLPSEELDLTLTDVGAYKHGIIFSGMNDKGHILLHLFKKLDYHPTKIIFIDDKMKNVIAVQKAVESAGIEFVGIHYTGCEAAVVAFKENITEHEQAWEDFKNKTGRYARS